MDHKGTIVMQKYELGRLLGQGSFAKVYHARCVETGQSVAIKVVDKAKVWKAGIMDHIEREISVMRRVRHPNVVHLYEVMATKSKIYFVMEYARGGELFRKVEANGRLPEDVGRKYFVQLIDAVEFCHGRGVCHRDLKPENILLDEDGGIKVSDFGLSGVAECRGADGLLHTTCGTPAYVAPEIIRRSGYDGAGVDVWSCGVVLFVLLAGYLPFHDSNVMEMYRKISRGEYRFPSWFSPKLKKLISRMLDPNPSTRISIARIKASSWFKAGNEGGPVKVKSDGGEARRLLKMNAFDIISLSDGLDLSKLFETGSCLDKECRIMSRKPVPAIVTRLERAARAAEMRVSKKDGGLIELERSKESRDGVLSIEAEIFVVTPALHLVEVRRRCGDAAEYEKVLNEVIRPRLVDSARSCLVDSARSS
ncbi:CBL-interacting protein kinase 5-like [Salvia hispanica]|uniref:CBL-interacting protein kinase 5-like n=1 Tax=Salvia hispanica TaxID=49212 RepID=UPI0020097E62|nr:CBL-interacting protein kinase 5-like [Salvia hispanica]